MGSYQKTIKIVKMKSQKFAIFFSLILLIPIATVFADEELPIISKALGWENIEKNQ